MTTDLAAFNAASTMPSAVLAPVVTTSRQEVCKCRSMGVGGEKEEWREKEGGGRERKGKGRGCVHKGLQKGAKGRVGSTLYMYIVSEGKSSKQINSSVK